MDKKQFWEEKYQNKSTGWDIGYASPALIDYATTSVPKDAKILIPGCGYGHEVKKLNQLGYKKITVVDIATTPLEKLRKELAEHSSVKFINQDFFTLNGKFDYVLEQTFFCALSPLMRPKYVQKMHELLSPSGILAGVLFSVDFGNDHPPFGGSSQEYKSLFSLHFDILKMQDCYNSIPPRMGNELFIELRAK